MTLPGDVDQAARVFIAANKAYHKARDEAIRLEKKSGEAMGEMCGELLKHNIFVESGTKRVMALDTGEVIQIACDDYGNHSATVLESILPSGEDAAS